MKLKVLKNVGTGFLAGVLIAVILALLCVMCLAPEIFLVFFILKLCGVVTFGWFWVFFPLIVEVCTIIIYTMLIFICD